MAICYPPVFLFTSSGIRSGWAFLWKDRILLTVILIMTAGMLIGFFLKRKQAFFHFLNRITGIVIYLLLFFLGLSVGQNEQVIKNFHLLGLRALVITLASIGGSVLLASGLYHLFFRSRNLPENRKKGDEYS